MVSHGRLARSLLPVQQGIAFLEQQAHIPLLQRGELALLRFFVAESQPVDIGVDPGIGSHFGERGLLTQELLALAGDQFSGQPVLFLLLFVHPGQFGQPFSGRDQLPERDFAPLDLIEQMRSIGFELVAVRGLDQRDLLTGDFVLTADVPSQDGEHFGASQSAAFPLLILRDGTVRRGLLVPESGNERDGLIVVFPQMGMGFQFEQVFVDFVLKLPFGPPCNLIGLAPQFHPDGFSRLPRLSDLFPEFFEREEAFRIVRPHFYMLRLPQESHDFCTELFDARRGERIVRKTDLAEEREHGFHLVYLTLVPEPVEHERVRNDDQHQSSRIQQIAGFPAEIELRQTTVEIEVVGRIAEQQVEEKAGIVAPQVALLDMGLRIEVAGYRHRIGIDVETVGIVEIRKMVHEIADSAAHIEDHLRRIGRREGDHAGAKVVRRKKLSHLELLFGPRIVVVRVEILSVESVQSSEPGIAVVDRFCRKLFRRGFQRCENRPVDLGALLLGDVLRDICIDHNEYGMNR